MILRDIRDRIWAQADYAPAGSPEGVVRTRGFINRALQRIAMDAPFLFEEEVEFFIDPDVRPDTTVTAVTDSWIGPAAADAWVLRTSYDSSTTAGAALVARLVPECLQALELPGGGLVHGQEPNRDRC